MTAETIAIVSRIYALRDPVDGSVRYVGRTTQSLEARLKSHLSTKDRSARARWIAALREGGTAPQIDLLEEVRESIPGKIGRYSLLDFRTFATSDCRAREREIYWIRMFCASGAPILNKSKFRAAGSPR